MNTTVMLIAIAAAGGVLVGSLARPRSWRLFGAVLALGLIFFVLELGRALWRGTSLADLVHVVTLSSTPAFQDYVGAMVIAYAAFLAAVIIALRIALGRRKAPHEA